MNKLAMICTLGVLLLLVAATVTIFGQTHASAHQSTKANAHFKFSSAETILRHQPVGTADLKWDLTTTNLTVTIAQTGLTPSSTHPAHIHLGVCNSNGAVIYMLTNVVADAHGVGSSTTTIAKVANGIPASGWYVNVHNGPGLGTPDEHVAIACGVVNNASHAQEVKVKLGSTSDANQSAIGASFLTFNNGNLTVYVAVHGLVPGSQHAVHVHAGSCESQGGVLYMLKDVTADANGNAVESMSFPNVPSIPATGWYVNFHYGNSAALSTQTGFDPIACGDVTSR